MTMQGAGRIPAGISKPWARGQMILKLQQGDVVLKYRKIVRMLSGSTCLDDDKCPLAMTAA